MKIWILILLCAIPGCLGKTDKFIRDCIQDVGTGTTVEEICGK